MAQRHLFFWLFLLAGLSPLQAQPWALGIQMGQQFSTLMGESDQDYAPGFIGGVHASHYLTEQVVIRTEVNFERRGSRVPAAIITDPEFASAFELDYLSLPVMLRYSTTGKYRFLAGGGASAQWLIRERTLYGEVQRDQTNQFRRLNADLLASIGGAYAFAPQTTLSMDLRASFGLAEVTATPGGVQRQLGRHILWALVAGLNFYL